MRKYMKTTLLELVERTNEGDYLVQNEGKPEDQWIIPKKVFETTYMEAPSGLDFGDVRVKGE